jgi:hypothetical protein
LDPTTHQHVDKRSMVVPSLALLHDPASAIAHTCVLCLCLQPDGDKVTAGVGLLGGEVNKLLSDHAK